MKINLSLTLKDTLKLSLFLPKKKNLIIKNEGNYYLLRKVYIIVSEDLRYLIHSKKYLYLYYPIKIIDYSTIKKFLSNLDNNKYRLCSNKEQIINEVKIFLGIENDFLNYKFNIYDEKLNLITNDYQLSQKIKTIKNNINNIIYVKIVQLKNEEIKLKKEKYQLSKKLNCFFIQKIDKNDSRKVIKNLKFQNQKLNILDEVLNINKREKNNSHKKDANSPSIGRKRKLNNNLFFINSYCSFSKKINKNTSTDDLEIKKKNQIITNDKNINNKKYPLFYSYTSRTFNNKKRNGRIEIDKIKKNFYNKKSNLSKPDYYKTMDKKNIIKIVIKENNLLKSLLKKGIIFNNKLINNIFLKNNFFNNRKESIRTLSEKYIIKSSHDKFNSYFNSNIKNIYNQKLKEIYFDKRSLSPIKKNNYYIRLHI